MYLQISSDLIKLHDFTPFSYQSNTYKNWKNTQFIFVLNSSLFTFNIFREIIISLYMQPNVIIRGTPLQTLRKSFFASSMKATLLMPEHMPFHSWMHASIIAHYILKLLQSPFPSPNVLVKIVAGHLWMGLLDMSSPLGRWSFIPTILCKLLLKFGVISSNDSVEDQV